MNISINAVFRKQTEQSKPAPVPSAFQHKTENLNTSARVTLNINEWDFENQRVRGQTPNCRRYNSHRHQIDELRRKIKRFLGSIRGRGYARQSLETNGRKINCTVGEYLK